MQRRTWLTSIAASCSLGAIVLGLEVPSPHSPESSKSTTTVAQGYMDTARVERGLVALPRRVEPPVVQPVSTTIIPPTTSVATTTPVVVHSVATTKWVPPTVHVAAPVNVGGVWACIAQHESGGNPATNTGNGYYGMFQDTQGSWVSGGGLAFAPRADLATAAQQLIVNERVQQQQGWGAWPVTSRMCGV
jgi:hypothetical protein